jgi:predicted DNA-binding transcriptional regulator YafY
LTLSAAAQQCRRVWLRYLSWQSEETERAVDLYGLVYRGGFWYAVGYCHLRQGLRVFRLDRILHAVMRDETYTRPDDFDALEYVMRSIVNVPATWSIEVLLETSLEEARQRVPPVIATLQQASDGILMQCSVGNLGWIAHLLAGLDCSFIVRNPPELRDELRKLAEKIAQMAERTI